MNKRVPMIRPLYEVVTPSSAAASATSHNTTTASTQVGDTSITTSDIMKPLRKSKRLRSPFLDKDDDTQQPELKKSRDDLKSRNLRRQSSISGNTKAGASSNVIAVDGNGVKRGRANGAVTNGSTSEIEIQSQNQQPLPNSTSSGIAAKSSTTKAVTVPTSSKAIPVVDEDAYFKVIAICAQERILWAKVKGHPYWPTQVVRMDINLASQERFKTALRFRRKGDDTCLMYFGTCEVAWINVGKSTMSWGDGLEKGFHRVLRARPKYQLALNQVLRYCAQKTEYPRGWWSEPACFSLSHEFLDICRGASFEKLLKRFSATAERERVCWGKMKGYPYWPVQVLPFSVVFASYPELKLREPLPGQNPSSWPCMFFGTGEVAMISDRAISPFITGIRKRFWAASDSHSFAISLGEMWGYLQKNRVWPSGYASGRLWWNYGTKDDSETTPNVQPPMPQFTRLKTSIYAPGVPKPSHSAGEDNPRCSCRPDLSACSDSTCLNVATRFWCDDKCGAGQTCVNRPFNVRGSPKVSAFYTTDQRGWGLRVEEPVQKGSFIISYIGEILDRKTLSTRLDKKNSNGHTEYYIMETNDDYFIDAEHRGNLARFINSSCAPNCESQKWTDPATGQTHVGIFALKDIKSGTEITYDYRRGFGFGFDESKIRSFVCRCRADTCCMLEPAERDHVVRCVGKRIRVRWDDGWYLGRVESYSQDRKRFRILYDDGDDEELTLGLPTLPKNGDGISFKLLDENDQELKNGV